MRKFLIPALAALAISGAANAKAPEFASEVVKVQDLDLTVAEDYEILESRIELAADRVCLRTFRRDLVSTAKFNQCKATAVAGAMEQVAALEVASETAFAGR